MAYNAKTKYREFRISNSKINLFRLRKPQVHKHKRVIKGKNQKPLQVLVLSIKFTKESKRSRN